MKSNLIKLSSLFLAAAVALVFSGCSSTPDRVNEGAIRAKSFQFVTLKPSSASFVEKREAVHSMIQKAIKSNLSARGVTYVQSGGEVTVAYLLVIGNNASTVAVNDYFGYDRDGQELADKAHKAYDTAKSPNYFEAGTLLIDVLSSQSGKLLWRGHVTKPVLNVAADDVRAQRVQDAVNELLATCRISP